MNHSFIRLAIVISLLYVAVSCSTGNDGSNTLITFHTDSVVEQGSFKKSNGELCKIKANVIADYPLSFKDSTTTLKLQQLFNRKLLKSQGAISTKNAISALAKSIVSVNTPSATGQTRAAGEENYDDVEDIDIENFESVVTIHTVYNDNNIVSFCREEKLKKNGTVTSVAHHYVNIDLETMKEITLSSLFKVESLPQVTKGLKDQLLSDKDADNEDELNDMGYFNLPNLTVTGNFFFTDSGISWSYEQGVIAVSSVGEPVITLDYDELVKWKNDDSVLNRF